jgi:hypothetical protein
MAIELAALLPVAGEAGEEQRAGVGFILAGGDQRESRGGRDIGRCAADNLMQAAGEDLGADPRAKRGPRSGWLAGFRFDAADAAAQGVDDWLFGTQDGHGLCSHFVL